MIDEEKLAKLVKKMRAEASAYRANLKASPVAIPYIYGKACQLKKDANRVQRLLKSL